APVVRGLFGHRGAESAARPLRARRQATAGQAPVGALQATAQAGRPAGLRPGRGSGGAGPSFAAEGGRFFVGPGSSRPAESGLDAAVPTLVGRGKPGPTVEFDPSLAAEGGRFLWGRVHPGQRGQAWARCDAPPPSAGVNPALQSRTALRSLPRVA